MNNPTTSSSTSPAAVAPLLRLPKVLEITGLGRSTVYRMIADRTFPIPVKLSCRAVGWKMREFEEWTLSRRPVREQPRIGGVKP